MRIDELEELLDRLAADGRRPKFIYSVPTFQNPAGVTMSRERRRRLVEIARERELLVVEDNPYGLLRYEGEPDQPLYQLDGGDYVIYLGTFSKILSPGIRLGWLCAPPPVMEKVVLGKQASDLCTSTLTQYFVAEYFAEGRWRDYVDEPHRPLPRAPRRDARGARAPLPRAGELDAAPRAASSCGRRCPTTSTRPTCWRKALRENVAFVPGAAAYVDGRGTSSMRLNFSASNGGRDPRGDRRIGQVVSEQVALYETITGESPPRRSGPSARAAGGGPGGGGRRRAPAAPARGERRGEADAVAVLKGGRSLERAGLAALGGARRGRAAHARPRGDPDRRRRRPGRAAQRRAPRRRLRRPARHRRRGRHRRRSCSRSSASRYTGPGVAACMRSHRQGRRQARAPRRRDPDARLGRVQRHRLPRARGRRHARGDRGAARLPARGQAREPAALRSGVRFAAGRDDVPAGARRRVLLRRPRPARAPRRRARAGGRRSSTASRCRSSRRSPKRGGPLQLRGPLRDRAHRVRLPGRAAGRRGPAGQGGGPAHLGGARAARASRAST